MINKKLYEFLRIGEAISLADKIVVLSARPSKVKKVFDINFEEEKPLDRRSSKKFSEYYSDVWGEIDE